ncbi:tetratricopeptide repeat protein [Flavobacterium sp. NG2]|uniref:tetratricopeptide repeat protein n=1 Tax=Flavobacterium sp. NG2 TaxID=3097547 RepID=UPI002A8344E0|nr:tetratricopeptide repeat protein [Flavobacterium sp. NG2]WPR71942.1 tetratricopeptide repeat protein [Flavobacterium sp. NG2]
MNEERYILFDQYLQGELSGTEKEAFERQLDTDSELAASFETFKEVNLQLHLKFGIETERNAFKENLSKIASKPKRTKKSKLRTLQPWYYSVAASIVIVLGAWVLLHSSKPIFTDYNQHENAYFTERGDVNANLKLAQDAFNAKNYKEAITQFEIILKEKPSPEIELYYGISLLETNKLKEAEVVFNELQSGTSIYKDKATWNLALLKLKLKDYDACEALLKTIPADYEGYDKVKELLDKLD